MRVDRGNIATYVLIGMVTLAIALTLALSESPVDWSQRYVHDSDEPYGLSVIYQLLRERYGEDNVTTSDRPIPKVMADTLEQEAFDYVFMGYARPFNPEETRLLMDFVRRGNNVFLAVESMDEELLDTLLDHDCFSGNRISPPVFESVEESGWESSDSHFEMVSKDTAFVSDSSLHGAVDSSLWFTSVDYEDRIVLNLENIDHCIDSGYHYYNFYHHDTSLYRWSVFRDLCLENIEELNILGRTAEESTYFISVPHGSGQFYFHTIPAAFTNVDMLRKDQLVYAGHIFDLLEHDYLIWDNYVSKATRSKFTPDLDADSPLSYILSERPLRVALYLCVAAALLYIVFRAKRRRRLIRVMEPNTNTSLEFVRMIGHLYYDQQDHRFIAEQLWNQFRDHVRVNYYLKATLKENNWVAQLANKSRVEENLIVGILRARRQAAEGNYTEDDLINFYNKLKYFYSNSK